MFLERQNLGQKKSANLSQVLVKLKCCLHMLIAVGDSDEHLNILINSELLPSEFWQSHEWPQLSGLLMNESNGNCKSEGDKCVNVI